MENYQRQESSVGSLKLDGKIRRRSKDRQLRRSESKRQTNRREAKGGKGSQDPKPSRNDGKADGNGRKKTEKERIKHQKESSGQEATRPRRTCIGHQRGGQTRRKERGAEAGTTSKHSIKRRNLIRASKKKELGLRKGHRAKKETSVGEGTRGKRRKRGVPKESTLKSGGQRPAEQRQKRSRRKKEKEAFSKSPRSTCKSKASPREEKKKRAAREIQVDSSSGGREWRMESSEKKSGDEDCVMDGHRNSRPVAPLCAANRAAYW
jgi:hypothetical protein